MSRHLGTAAFEQPLQPTVKHRMRRYGRPNAHGNLAVHGPDADEHVGSRQNDQGCDLALRRQYR
eukprot:scaffold47051_cov219-Isochrysis_galbana.AAC.1